MTELTNDAYSKALVSYIDVLGFGDFVAESRSDPSRISRIADLLTTMKEDFSAGGRTHRKPDGRKEKIFNSFNFSDLIVRSTRMPYGADVGEFIDWELSYLGEKQFALARDGVLVRGGVCIGDLFVRPDAGIVFGPALVKAYKLESQYAIYPRIIIDRDLIGDAHQQGYIEHWRDSFQRGEDGAYYLDYLFDFSLARYVLPEPEDPDPATFIEEHRNMIEAVIKNGIREKHERIRQKYMWLALYHNSAIGRLAKRLNPRLDRERDRLMIPENLLTF
jgi:hypothetical protein